MTKPQLRVTETETITVVNSSMEYDDDRHEVRSDVGIVLSKDRDPDVVGWTETEQDPVLGVCQTVSRERGYLFRGGGPGGVSFSLHPRHQLLRVIDIQVLDPKPAPFPHGARSVFGPVFRTPAGNVLTYLLGHWTTLDRGLPKWQAMTEAMIEEMLLASAGDRIGIWSGDLNKGDTPRADVFSRNGLATVWDRTGQYPDTYGAVGGGDPIDVIGVCDRDTRVEVVNAYAGGRKRRRADHRFVAARLRIHPTAA